MLLKTKIRQLCKIKKDIEKMNPCKMPETYKTYPYYLDDECWNTNFLDSVVSRLSVLNISINSYNESINACQRSLEVVNMFKAKLSMLKAKVAGISAALCVQFDILRHQVKCIYHELNEIIEHISNSNLNNHHINCMPYEERKYFYIKDGSTYTIYYDLNCHGQLIDTSYNAIPAISNFTNIMTDISGVIDISSNDAAFNYFGIIENLFIDPQGYLNRTIEGVAELLETLCVAKDRLEETRKKQIHKFEEWKEKTIDSIENKINALTSCECDC
jgi:hypothetical protein